MAVYLFQLGTTPKLSFAELQAVLGETGTLLDLNPAVAIEDLPVPTQPQVLLDALGGTVKIAQVWRQLPLSSKEAAILTAIKEYFLTTGAGKLHFALGELGRDQEEALDVIKLKRELEAAGRKVRFAATPRHGAGAALLSHRSKIQEVLVVSNASAGVIYLATTVAVQNIDQWAQRDRGKPYANHTKGMLPPKLGRLMVNLAGRKITGQKVRLYDPFCGTGTILGEAALAGDEVLGSDLDPKAVQGTKKNLEWLAQNYGFDSQVTVFQADATQVELKQLGGQRVDLIVTEPFLGRQTPLERDLANVQRGLSKLYWGAFRQWRRLLKDGGRVVIVFPRLQTRAGQVFHLDGLLDKLEGIGYTCSSQELFYQRPGAITGRELKVFDYKVK